MKRLITKANYFTFFGKKPCKKLCLFIYADDMVSLLAENCICIAQNVDFTAAALEFPQTVIFTTKFLCITPIYETISRRNGYQST